MSPLQFDFGLAFKKKTFQSSRGLHKGTFHNSTRTSQDSWLPRSPGGEAGPAGVGGLKGTTGVHVATFSSGLPAWGGLGSLKDCGWHGAGGPHSLPGCPGPRLGPPSMGAGHPKGAVGFKSQVPAFEAEGAGACRAGDTGTQCHTLGQDRGCIQDERGRVAQATRWSSCSWGPWTFAPVPPPWLHFCFVSGQDPQPPPCPPGPAVSGAAVQLLGTGESSWERMAHGGSASVSSLLLVWTEVSGLQRHPQLPGPQRLVTEASGGAHPAHRGASRSRGLAPSRPAGGVSPA